MISIFQNTGEIWSCHFILWKLAKKCNQRIKSLLDTQCFLHILHETMAITESKWLWKADTSCITDYYIACQIIDLHVFLDLGSSTTETAKLKRYAFWCTKINNISILSEKIKFISTIISNRWKSKIWQAFLSCFAVRANKKCANIEKNRNIHHSNCSQGCLLSRPYLYYYLFYSSLYMIQVPEKLYFGWWPYIKKMYPVNAIWLFK